MNGKVGDLLVKIPILIGSRVAAHERCQFAQRQGSVELEIRPYGGQHLLLNDLVHEYLGLMLYSFPDVVVLLRVRSGRRRREKLRAGEQETGLKLNKIAVLHLVHLLVIVAIPQSLLEALVDALRMKNQADREQVIHLLGLLVYLIILVAPRREQLFGALNVQETA